MYEYTLQILGCVFVFCIWMASINSKLDKIIKNTQQHKIIVREIVPHVDEILDMGDDDQ